MIRRSSSRVRDGTRPSAYWPHRPKTYLFTILYRIETAYRLIGDSAPRTIAVTACRMTSKDWGSARNSAIGKGGGKP